MLVMICCDVFIRELRMNRKQALCSQRKASSVVPIIILPPRLLHTLYYKLKLYFLWWIGRQIGFGEIAIHLLNHAHVRTLLQTADDNLKEKSYQDHIQLYALEAPWRNSKCGIILNCVLAVGYLENGILHSMHVLLFSAHAQPEHMTFQS